MKYLFSFESERLFDNMFVHVYTNYPMNYLYSHNVFVKLTHTDPLPFYTK